MDIGHTYGVVHRPVGPWTKQIIIERLQTLLDFLVQSAKQGDKKYEQHMKDGHHLKYLSDIKYIAMYKDIIQQHLQIH